MRAIAIYLLALLLLAPTALARTDSREFVVGSGLFGMDAPFGTRYSLGGASFDILLGESRLDVLVHAPTGAATFAVSFIDAQNNAIGPTSFACGAGGFDIPSGAARVFVNVGRPPFSHLPFFPAPGACASEIPPLAGTISATFR